MRNSTFDFFKIFIDTRLTLLLIHSYMYFKNEKNDRWVSFINGENFLVLKVRLPVNISAELYTSFGIFMITV